MRKLFIVAIFLLSALFIIIPNVSAHELYIQVEELKDSEELRVDIFWGHIRDYVSESNLEDFQLYTRYPNGDVKQLDLEESGVQARTYVPITSDGTYTFWATREKSTYTPEDSGVTQLSNHMAKVIHHVGTSSSSNANEEVDMEFEIIPDVDISAFITGVFSGTVNLNGSPISDATIHAYGPDQEVIEESTDTNGNFEMNLDSNGKWLIKANVLQQEQGTMQGEAYEEISNTTTLLIETDGDDTSYNLWLLLLMLVIGLFVGAAVTLFTLKKKK
ncbi:Uncharacterized conserved protein, contains GH25 family domain [Oceanobacillus limi]|uniref:Uncharacterized conserved protein, contains GH25 family domain n=1 Tax=Oceanobacillus limi TaxID=930131 RepID=A0A1I0FDH8_9BACI|nr:DUF4198 domain-containing protein [Oceanobacillus limi]SET55405.1 Uncharacterized conserved protein, contains GH25 family domain [Oceanobacillus limi]